MYKISYNLTALQRVGYLDVCNCDKICQIVLVSVLIYSKKCLITCLIIYYPVQMTLKESISVINLSQQ